MVYSLLQIRFSQWALKCCFSIRPRGAVLECLVLLHSRISGCTNESRYGTANDLLNQCPTVRSPYAVTIVKGIAKHYTPGSCPSNTGFDPIHPFHLPWYSTWVLPCVPPIKIRSIFNRQSIQRSRRAGLWKFSRRGAIISICIVGAETRRWSRENPLMCSHLCDPMN